MIDLEEALAPLVARAPDPPAVDGVARRGRQRQLRRRALATGTALVLVVAALGIATAIVTTKSTPKVARLVPVVPINHARVTLLDGSQLEISGMKSLGLTKLDPSFNAELLAKAGPDAGASHSFTVQRAQPVETGKVVARLSNLTLYETDGGVDAVMQFGNWWLVNSWGQGATHWARFVGALRLVSTPDGYLEYQNDDMDGYNSDHWRLGPTAAPDLQLNDDAGNPVVSFFGPSSYPAVCPIPSRTNGTWWCDASAKVGIQMSDPRLRTAAMKQLRVSYTDPDHAVQQVTALDRTRYEVTAPKDAFTQYSPHAVLTVDGMATRSPLTVSVGRSENTRPNPGPRYPTADGTRMFGQSDEDQLAEIVGIYGPWLLDVYVAGLSEHDAARVASLIRAHATADGLVLDPVPPMHFKAGTGSAISFVGAEVRLAANGSVRVTSIANRPIFAGLPPPIADKVHARVIH